MSSEEYAPIDFLNDGQEQQNINNRENSVAENFNRLTSLNLSDRTESKNGLSYISWANAWKVFKEVYPTASYRVIRDPNTNLPYFVDPAIGIMVMTEVSADGLTYSMWLPVMDGANKAMKKEAYTYQVWDKTNRKYIDKKVDAASMFDINKTLMRCLVKNLSMFGLALYIYAGEDLPESMESQQDPMMTQQQSKPKRQRKPADRYENIRLALNAVRTKEELNTLYRQHESEVRNNPQILALFTARKQELINVA